jgi:cell division protein FtsQ
VRETRSDRYRQAAAQRVSGRPSSAPSRSHSGRYRARRHQKERAPLLTRSRLRTLLAGLAVSTIFACLTFVNRSPLFAIRQVRVTGLVELMPDEAGDAQAAAELPSNTNFFHLNRRQLESEIESVPAVAAARISRRFPNRVEIVVTPRRPVAILAAGAARWEVDRGGVAIRPERPGQKLPEIDCASASNVAPGQRIDVPGVAGALSAASLCAAAPNGKPLGIAKIEVDQNGDMCLNMVDSVAIRFGQGDQLDTKLALVRRIYNERPDIGAEVETIDLRFPEAPACLTRGTAKHEREPRQPAAHSDAGAREHEPSIGPAGTAINNHLEPTSTGQQQLESNSKTGRRRRARSHRFESDAVRRGQLQPEQPEPRR